MPYNKKRKILMAVTAGLLALLLIVPIVVEIITGIVTLS